MGRFDMRDMQAIWEPPSSEALRVAWVGGAEDSVAFLKSNSTHEEMILYASGPSVLIHGVLAPTSQVSPADQDDLMHDFIDPEASWCIERAYGGGEGHRIYLEPTRDIASSPEHFGRHARVHREQFVLKRRETVRRLLHVPRGEREGCSVVRRLWIKDGAGDAGTEGERPGDGRAQGELNEGGAGVVDGAEVTEDLVAGLVARALAGGDGDELSPRRNLVGECDRGGRARKRKTH